MAAAYEAARAAYMASLEVYTAAQKAYRAGTIPALVFIAVRAQFDAARTRMDDAHASLVAQGGGR